MSDPQSSAASEHEPRIPLADHDAIGRAVLSQPWEVQKAIVTIAAHCTCIMDEEPSAKVADLVGCISQTCKELADALHVTVTTNEPQSPSVKQEEDCGCIGAVIGQHERSCPLSRPQRETEHPQSSAASEPAGWLVERPGDSTFPRLFRNKASADALVEYVNVNPHATSRPVFLNEPQAAVKS